MTQFDPTRLATALTRQIKFNSVLNTLLWALAFQIIFLVVSGFSGATNIQSFLMWTSGGTLLLFLGLYVWLLRKNPNLLRSEEYNFQMAALDKLGSNTHESGDITNLPSVTSPVLPSPESAPQPTPQPNVPEQQPPIT